MAKHLVIVESPAKAKTIGKYLGRTYKVEASMGHVRDLPKSTMGVDLEHDFEPKYLNIRGKGPLIKKLKTAAKSSDNVILATDPDREGEAISWHLMNALGLDEKKTSRVVFNEITKDAVKTAIQNPRDIDYNLVDAQQARRVLDRVVGYSISPILWRKVRKGLSAGRVQSVALRMICERENEILNFEPEEYWSLDAALTHKKTRKKFKAKFYGDKKGKIDVKNEAQAKEILQAVEHQEFVVDSVKRTPKKRQPAPPFITSSLQQEAARKLGFTPSKTMRIAQQLYEGVELKGEGAVGLITYMRTDSTRVANEAALAAKDYIKATYGENFLPASPRTYKKGKNAQDAHEAIRPSVVSYTPQQISESLTGDQNKLYKLIWERFIASQMAEAKIETMTVNISAGAYLFRATGSTVLFPGFLTLYEEGKDEEKSKEKEQKLPDMEAGDELAVNKIDPVQHFTQPPARYTEATLVRAMEEQGIGRPSTYAPTVATILARNYVIKEKRSLVPTELGEIVTNLMKEHFTSIVDSGFTADMEQKLDDVEDGRRDWKEIIRDFYGPFEKVIQDADSKIPHVEIKPEETDIPCEKCGRMMVIRDGRYGKFLACPGFPECRNARPIQTEIGVDCPKCGAKLLEKKSRKGVKYYGCEKHPDCDFMSWNLPTNDKCPVCGKMLLQRTMRGRLMKDSFVCIDEECSYNAKKEKKKPTEGNE